MIEENDGCVVAPVKPQAPVEMTAAEHRAEAIKLMGEAEGSGFYPTILVAKAQVHATLALSAQEAENIRSHRCHVPAGHSSNVQDDQH